MRSIFSLLAATAWSSLPIAAYASDCSDPVSKSPLPSQASSSIDCTEKKKEVSQQAAQTRNAGNVITQANDAFGSSVGRESIGIYTSASVRGFSAVAAGNVRINSMYFDQIQPLYPMMRETTNIKIGLSAAAYPFPAPTGVVDYKILTPKQSSASSITTAIDSWGGVSLQVDRDQVFSSSFAIAGSLGIYRNEFRNGTDNSQILSAVAAHWTPMENVTIQPFWQRSVVRDDDTGPLYIMAGDYLPPKIKRRSFNGPSWLDANTTSNIYGLLARYRIGLNIELETGFFHSRIDTRTDAAHLYTNLDQNGVGRQITILDPPSTYISTSGEIRLSHAFGSGNFQHKIYLNLRGRQKRRNYDGSDEIDLGLVRLDERRNIELPKTSFTMQSRESLDQSFAGIGYHGKWGQSTEVSAGLQKTYYKKITAIPDLSPLTSRSSPWLYNAAIVGTLNPQLAIYGSLVKGLEESGVAPASAVNRNQPLQAIETSQREIGMRWQINRDVRAILGTFRIKKPYFQTSDSGLFEPLGAISNRGFEFSVNGKLRPNFTLVTGGTFNWLKVSGPQVNAGKLGMEPVGLPSRTLRLNLDWKPPVNGTRLSLDIGVSHVSSKWANKSNSLRIPDRTLVDLGVRYRIDVGCQPLHLRLVVTNLFDIYGYEPVTSGVFDTIPGRQAFLSFVTEF